MKRFIQGSDRTQGISLSEQADNYVEEESSVWVVDISVEELDLARSGFAGIAPAYTGRPSCHAGDH